MLNRIARLAQVCSELLHLSAELRPVATPQRRQCLVIVRGGSFEAWWSIRMVRSAGYRLGRLPGKRDDDVRRGSVLRHDWRLRRRRLEQCGEGGLEIVTHYGLAVIRGQHALQLRQFAILRRYVERFHVEQ